MGPFVVMLFWAAVLTPVGLLLGALVSFVGIPLFLKLRRSRGTDRHTGYLPRFALMFLICAVFVSVMVCLGGWLMEKDSGDYWKSKGAWDV